MRIDMFLDSVNLTKKRSIAQEMIAHGALQINGASIKPSKEVKVGDKITMKHLKSDGTESLKVYEVLSIPSTRNNQKAKQEEFVKEIS